jgi:two-component system LytT family sensor kinase
MGISLIGKGVARAMQHTDHSSLVINAIGHCAGALAFGLLLYLIFLSRHRTYRAERLVTAAAALAFIWNAGSLLALTLTEWKSPVVDLAVAVSFSALSLLPAVLLHVAFPEWRSFWLSGYVLSGVAMILHLLESLRPNSRSHYIALVLITIGFGSLTILSLFLARRAPGKTHAAGRLATSMCLFLLAVSFVHFGTGHPREAWSSEIALHHAGIPLAMIILLQDYRFLLIDAFHRLAVDGALALGTAYALFELAHRANPLSASTNPGVSVLALIVASIALALFVQLRRVTQTLVTRLVFVQPDTNLVVQQIRALSHQSAGEDAFLKEAFTRIADSFSCRKWDVMKIPPGHDRSSVRPFPVSSSGKLSGFWKGPDWVEAVVPVRLAEEDPKYLALGPRLSRRRYLSEDLETLETLAAVLADETARMRSAEARRLMTQAELRALQAQINPHFLFNALNTIYGVISRENAVARNLVLHLADLFRFFFRPEQMMIPLEEEVRIVRAYLEIEQARLGPKLHVSVNVGATTRGIPVPSLCIQPLVENAVKHGAAARSQGGFVTVSIQSKGDVVSVEVVNSGTFVRSERERIGVGLANVRRRLQLWYGAGSEVNIETGEDSTRVFFEIPVTVPVQSASAGI